MYFNSIVGLDRTKRKLGFLIDSYKNTNYFPPALICAGRGHGKTFLASEVARFLNKRGNSEIKPYVLINSATLSSFSNFVNQVYIPFIQDKETTIAFDECHEIPKKLMTAFLTLFNPNARRINHYTHDDVTLTFDFNYQSFLFMTTESHRVFHALQDRLEKIVLEPYSNEELGLVIKNKLPDMVISAELLDEIATVVRGNPRKSVQTAEKIQIYLENVNKTTLEKEDWEKVKSTLDILPLGVNRIELEILKVLAKRRFCNLTTLAAYTNLTRESLQKDHELYLLKNYLIEIATGSKRQLTSRGYQYVKNLGLLA